MMDGPECILKELRDAVSPESVIRCNEPLSRRTTLRVGGNADVYVEPALEEDLAVVLGRCAAAGLCVFVLGNGSNLLVRDGGIRGVVIRLSHPRFCGVEVFGDRLRCGAGARLKAVSVAARRSELGGFEFLEGIPGSVGGGLRMNAGAMGWQIMDRVETVRMMDWKGAVTETAGAELGAGYRNCMMLRTRIALSAVMKGQTTPASEIAERTKGYNRRRWSTQPAAPSAGCVFRNPDSIPAGRLIEELGLKGTRSGGAAISEKHGNFIVNEGGASAGDVLRLIDLVRQRARDQRGIELETELEIVGEAV